MSTVMTPSAACLALVVGGAEDPNVHALCDALERRRIETCRLLVGPGVDPWIAWDLERDELVVNGRPLAPQAVFLRHDVFSHLGDARAATAQRALAWYCALEGWVSCHPEVRTFNREHRGAANKPHVLHLARQLGLAIPRTLVTNAREQALAFAGGQPSVAKPVAGGGLCRPLEHALASVGASHRVLASPALVQERLVPPEQRLYVIGSQVLGFLVESPHLDYREHHDARVVPTAVDPELADKLLALAQRMGLDFAAADFKTSPIDQQPRFLEINTGPMFAAFDRAAAGALTDTMVDVLCGRA